MTKTDKRALRQTAEKALAARSRLEAIPDEDVVLFEDDDIKSDVSICNKFIVIATPQTVLALLDEDELKDARIAELEEALRDKQSLLEAAEKRNSKQLRVISLMLKQYDNHGSIDLTVTEAAEEILESAGVALDTGE